MSLHNTRHILVCLFSRANKDHNKMPRTRSAGLQCCTDRTAAGIMISLQRIAAGIVQTQSVRQTKILIILLSRFAKNCGTNLKCIQDLSSELNTARSDNLSFLLSINYIPLTTEPQKTIYGFNKIKGIVLVSQIIFLRTRALGRE